MPDLWLTCDHFVGKVSTMGPANQANSAFHPFGVGRWVVIHVTTWITGVETIKRQTRDAYGYLVAAKSPMAAGLAYSL